jgi:hypothetical protein
MHFNNYISRAAADSIGSEEITITPTAMKQTPTDTIQSLKERGIRVRVVESRGRPRTLSQGQIKRILAMKKSDVSFYRIARLTGVPKSTAFDYFKRYGDREMGEEDVEALQLKEARRIFQRIMAQDPGGEIGALARRGCSCQDLREMEYIARELNEIIREGVVE